MQNDPDVNSNNRMARLSLIAGIIGLPTCGLFCIGGLLGIWLGEKAYRNAKKYPEKFGYRGVALAGIITNSVAIAIGIFVFLNPTLIPSKKTKDDFSTVSPVGRLRTIASAELTYLQENGKYGTLKELAEFNLIDSEWISNPVKNKYRFYAELTENAQTYCVHADRVDDSSGDQDFIVCEDGVIRFIQSKQKGTVQRGAGEPLSNSYVK